MAGLVDVYPGAARSDAARLLGRLVTDPAGADRSRVVLVDTLDPHTAAQLTATAAARANDARLIVIVLRPDEADCSLALLELVDDVIPWGESVPAALACRLERDLQVRGMLEEPHVVAKAVGRAPPYLAALRSLAELASGPELAVLLGGETGTGKEVAADLVHTMSHRRAKPFVVVDCTTIVPTLSGSELFGHERGAFTGAVSTRSGAIAAAHGGTLFLDEVGELPLGLQAELLRVLQEGAYKRVGGDRWLASDFRLVSATNRDLRAEVDKGNFRADLFHRIAGATVVLPPLRDRTQDIEPLFQKFFTEVTSAPCPPLSPLALRMLHGRRWPGNVRELRQVAVRVASRHVGPGPITPGSIPREHPSEVTVNVIDIRSPDVSEPQATSPSANETSHQPPGVSHPVDVRSAIRQLLDAGHSLTELRQIVSDIAVDLALEEADGNTHAAAHRLGVSDRAVQARRSAGRATGALSD